MAFLTSRDIRRQYGPEAGEVGAWLKEKKLKNTRANRALASRRITAAKIKKTLGKSVSILESAGNWQVIYGEVRCGGTITFAHTTNNNQKLNLVVTLACHEIESVQKLYLDNQEVIFGDTPDPRWSTAIKDLNTGQTRAAVTKVFMAVNNGAVGNPAISDLIGQCPDKWTSDHKQDGRAHVYIQMIWDPILFPDGLPEISFLVRGKKCFDPRTSTIVWTQNPALQTLDYLTSTTYGLGIPIAECETGAGTVGSFRAAADICDQNVTILDGGTEKRFSGNGFFETGEDHQSVIEEMITSYAGAITFAGGRWKCFPGAYRAPTITLNENDILSDIRIVTRASKRDNFNAVKGTFVSPKANYEETDFPPIRNAFYRAQDNNEEIFEDIQLPFTTSGSTAQRIAKILLEQVRQPIVVELTATLKAFQVEAGETINLTWARFGWTAKTFDVLELEPQFIGSGDNLVLGVRLVLKETAAAIYDWNSGEETRIDLAPNTSLPDPFTVQTLAGLVVTSGTSELYTRNDGTIFSRMRVSWTAPVDAFVVNGGNIEISYKLASAASWSTAPITTGDASFIHILDVQDGATYEIRARTRSSFGVWSAYSSTVTHTVVGKTAAPSTVTGFAGAVSKFGITLNWSEVVDLDLSHYEIRLASGSGSWETAEKINEIRGTTVTLDIKTAGTYRFLIKSVDTSNNYSVTASEASIVIGGAAAPAVTFSIVGPDVVLSWGAVTGQFETKEYEIRYGATFASATVETTITGTKYQRRGAWSGLRTYWVVARDVAGNLGTPFSVDISITAPSAPQSPFSEIVSNNVLLKWQAPSTATLPIDRYEIRKGATFAGATIVGAASATFSAIFEQTGGTFVYWVVAYDTAGNQGTSTSISVKVDNPPNYTFITNQTVDLATGTFTNSLVDLGELFLSVNTSETYEGHFTARSWTTPQAQINAGYPNYIQPTRNKGDWKKTIDLGSTVTGALITVSYISRDIIGTTTLYPRIGYSNDNITFTESDTLSVFGTNFRYVRITLKNYAGGTIGTVSDTTALAGIKNLVLTVGVPTITDSGFGSVTNATSGATVTFNKTFIDINSIIVTPARNDTDMPTAVYDFTDAPNPTTFTVFLYATKGTNAGNRITGNFGWTAQGV
jgi:hypothetical protein